MTITERLFLGQLRHIEPGLDDPRTRAARKQITRDFGALVPPVRAAPSGPRRPVRLLGHHP